MELKVNENIRIVTDTYNFIVQESRVAEKDTKTHKKGFVVWDDQSYHGNLNDALKSLLSKGIRDFCDEFNSVMDFINVVHKKIDEIKYVKR